jgi:hypothetical protein
MKIRLNEGNREIGFVRVISSFKFSHSFDSRDHKIRLDHLDKLFGELTVFTCMIQKKNTKPAYLQLSRVNLQEISEQKAPGLCVELHSQVEG